MRVILDLDPQSFRIFSSSACFSADRPTQTAADRIVLIHQQSTFNSPLSWA